MTTYIRSALQLARKHLPLITTLAVLVVFAAYFLFNTEKFRPLLDVNLWLVLPVALLYLVSMTINGLFTKVILKPFGKFISMKESFYVSLISSVGNFFAPVGAGFGFRAIYLKRRHGLPYYQYISILSGNYVIVFLVNSLIGLVTLYLLRDRYDHQFLVLLLTFTVIFVVSLILSLVKIPVPKATGAKPWQSTLRSLQRVNQGWHQITADKQLMARLIGLTSVNVLLNVLIILAIVQALHLAIGGAVLVLFSVLSSLSLFINITPANLGIKEAIFIFSATVLGFSVSQILLISLIDRGVFFLVLLILWLFSNRFKDKGTGQLVKAPTPID